MSAVDVRSVDLLTAQVLHATFPTKAPFSPFAASKSIVTLDPQALPIV
jgi:hypothetical protein